MNIRFNQINKYIKWKVLRISVCYSQNCELYTFQITKHVQIYSCDNNMFDYISKLSHIKFHWHEFLTIVVLSKHSKINVSVQLMWVAGNQNYYGFVLMAINCNACLVHDVQYRVSEGGPQQEFIMEFTLNNMLFCL